MPKIALYMHSGSENHGCEAIVRSTLQIIGDTNCEVHSCRKYQDDFYGINLIADVKQDNKINKFSFVHILLYIGKMFTRSNDIYYKYIYKNTLNKHNDICISIGGDAYCYGDSPDVLKFINLALTKNGCQTVLWGCSVEPELLKKPSIVDDMKCYSLITARESITYNAMKEAGIKNVYLFPDPAFTLPVGDVKQLEVFDEKNTIGINVSPLVQRLETEMDMTIKNYIFLVDYIIKNTSSQIALIPHVVWESNNDLEPLKALYERFKETGRVVLINDCNCMQLKGYISKCRMFIGARTHATIAAYSTCVPTLVVGYSVKACGIAKDIFGTDENYVVKVQKLKNEDDLVKAFKWLSDNEVDIKNHLTKFMPEYIASAWLAGEKVRELKLNIDEN